MTTEISNYDDTIDVRDIISRVENLEADEAAAEPEYVEELPTLRALLDELKGYGGDEQWQGDWYPVTLVRDSHFKAYAQELAEDCGDIDFATLAWPLTCIDWDQAARELRMDYSSVEFGGVTYWYR
jgi:hypothetical protein